MRASWLDEPDPLPHPDHIKVDWKTGEVVIWGPLTRKGKEQYDMIFELKMKITLLEEECSETTDPKKRNEINERLLACRNAYKKLFDNWTQ